MKKDLKSYATLRQGIQELLKYSRRINFHWTVQLFTEKYTAFVQYDYFEELVSYGMILQSVSDLSVFTEA